MKSTNGVHFKYKISNTISIHITFDNNQIVLYLEVNTFSTNYKDYFVMEDYTKSNANRYLKFYKRLVDDLRLCKGTI